MRKLFYLIVAALLFTACENNISENDETEYEFVMNSGLKFIFVNDENEDLIDLSDSNTYPVSVQGPENSIDAINLNTYQEKTYYNGNMNAISLNSEINKVVWETIVYGYTNIPEYETHICFQNGDIDTIKVNYNFSTECYGSPICPGIEKVFYNKTLVFSKSELDPDYVYIEKNGSQTIVRVE